MTYKITYDKRTGGTGEIIVKGSNEAEAYANARWLCFTGSNFRDARATNDEYIKPSKQGFKGSEGRKGI